MGYVTLTPLLFIVINFSYILCLLIRLFVGNLNRTTWHCSICVLLLLPSACCYCRGNDAWSAISVYNHSPNEVIKLYLQFLQVSSHSFASILSLLLTVCLFQVGWDTDEFLSFQCCTHFTMFRQVFSSSNNNMELCL